MRIRRATADHASPRKSSRGGEYGSDCAKYSLKNLREQHKRCRYAPLGPLLGLHFRNVLGDAIRAERGLARRLPGVASRRARHCVRTELVHLLRNPSRASVPSRVDEAVTSLGRLIFFDQPGTGASDPIAPGALPTLEQWADSITAVLDDLDSREAVLLATDGAFAAAALFAATHPSRTKALVALDCYAAPVGGPLDPEEATSLMVGMWGTGEIQHVLNPDMPWNEEIRAAWARMERLAASPATVALVMPMVSAMDVRALLPSVRVPSLVVQYSDDAMIVPAMGKYVADHIPESKYVELPGRNAYHFVEPWRDSFREIHQFLTGHQPDVADDRVLATVLFTDIVDSTRRAAEIGDRDWHALLDAHDAVVRSQLARFRGREVNTSGDGFLAMFDGPQRAIRCAMAIRDAVRALGIEVRAGLHTGECEVRGDDIGGIAVRIGAG